MPLILLAEDESSTVDFVRAALSSQGWLVKTVGGRDQALRAASEFAPQMVLVNAGLEGAADLVRTFSRSSGGPGVILLTSAESEAASSDSPEVDAVLVKPLDAGDLIETIRKGLVNGKGKPAPPPVATGRQVFSSQDIFGDLLDDILDPEADEAPAETAAAAEPEAPVSKPAAEAPDVTTDLQTETAETATPKTQEIPVAGLEDLEEVVREGVEAWADSVRPDDIAEDRTEELAELAEATRVEPVTVTDIEEDEDLDSRLEDTLAGVLAASLTQADEAPTRKPSPSPRSDSVDDLLSRALGDLDLGSKIPAPKVEEVFESKIEDEIEALAATVEKETKVGVEALEDAAEPLEPTADVAAAEAEEEAEEETAEAESTAVEEKVEVAASEDAAAEGTAPETPIEPAKLEPETRVEAPDLASPPPESIEFGEYTLEKQIGVGGMATVWKARRKSVEGFEKRVAIKKILPQAAENEEFVEMFIDEAKLAAQLNHSKITHIYDLGKINDDYFIAMEYVEGKNLRQILDKSRKKEQPMPVGIALFIAAEIADALDYAHRSRDFDDTELGLVHRDISPQNVLISFEGDIKLCDFGVAKAVAKISTTQMGALKGKLQYMSPEQAWGRAIDHRSDLFSLGTVLFEMLTGDRLFSGESEMAVLEAVREADVGTRIIQSPDIPAAVKGLLLRSLAKDPGDRFDSAAELHRGLEELLKEESPLPGSKSLSTFVRTLLDIPAASLIVEEEVEEVIGPQLEVPADVEWEAETGTGTAEVEAETERTAWLRRVLTKLLPMVLVAAVGGGIIAGLMQSGGEAREGAVESVAQVAKVEAFESASQEDSGVDPQGQPPPAVSANRTKPASPAESQPRKSEPDPAPAKAKPTAPQTTNTPAAVPPSSGVADPELERRVEKDLKRVQELMQSPDESAEQADRSRSSVVEPRVLEFNQPEYTEAARRAGVAGTIRLSVLVGEDGRALQVRLLEGLESQVGLEEAMIEAARNAKYQPATEDGTPVKMWYQMAVSYQP